MAKHITFVTNHEEGVIKIPKKFLAKLPKLLHVSISIDADEPKAFKQLKNKRLRGIATQNLKNLSPVLKKLAKN